MEKQPLLTTVLTIQKLYSQFKAKMVCVCAYCITSTVIKATRKIHKITD